jgi:hypothetical protein
MRIVPIPPSALRSLRRLAVVPAAILTLGSSLGGTARDAAAPARPALLDLLLAAETGCDTLCLPAASAGPVRDRIEELSRQAAESLGAAPDAPARESRAARRP